MDNLPKSDTFLPIPEVIRRARERGFIFGFGDPYNRIRYYIKIGLLPNMVRRSANGGPTGGHLPDSVVDRLVEIQKLRHDGYDNDKILEKLAVKERLAQLEQAKTTLQESGSTKFQILNPNQIQILNLKNILPKTKKSFALAVLTILAITTGVFAAVSPVTSERILRTLTHIPTHLVQIPGNIVSAIDPKLTAFLHLPSDKNGIVDVNDVLEYAYEDSRSLPCGRNSDSGSQDCETCQPPTLIDRLFKGAKDCPTLGLKTKYKIVSPVAKADEADRAKVANEAKHAQEADNSEKIQNTSLFDSFGNLALSSTKMFIGGIENFGKTVLHGALVLKDNLYFGVEKGPLFISPKGDARLDRLSLNADLDIKKAIHNSELSAVEISDALKLTGRRIFNPLSDISIEDDLEVTGNLRVKGTTTSGNLMPLSSDLYDIGSAQIEWNRIYGRNATITDTVAIGGTQTRAYNAISNIGGTPGFPDISSNNDLYIQGDLEVDGNIHLAYQHVIFVAKSGGDYTKIQDAINSITDNSSTSRYLIKVYPGVYEEAVNFTANNSNGYIDIEGSGLESTKIAMSSGATLVTGAANSRLTGFELNLTTGGVSNIVTSTTNSFIINEDKITGNALAAVTGPATLSDSEVTGTISYGVVTASGETSNVLYSKITSTSDDLRTGGTINSYYNSLLGSGNNVTTLAGGTANSYKDTYNKVANAGTFNQKDYDRNDAVTALNILQAGTGTALSVTGNSIATGTGISGTFNGLTTGTGLNLSSTGTILSGGYLANLTANSATTGTLLKISGTSLTSGSAVDVTAGTTTGNAVAVTANGLTSGTGVNISSTGTIAGTGNLVALTANSLTTGDLLDLSATGLTSGTGLKFTGPTSGETMTGNVIAATSNVGPSGKVLALSPTFSNTSGTSYGSSINGTDSASAAYILSYLNTSDTTGATSDYFIRAQAGGAMDRFTVDTQGTLYTAGNVGVGTTNPGYGLEVIGDARLSSNLTIGTAATPTLYVGAAGSATGYAFQNTSFTNLLSNASFETDGDAGGLADQWTSSGLSAYSQSATSLYQSYSQLATADAAADHFYQSLSASEYGNYKGKYVTASVWVRLSGVAETAQISVYDGVGTSSQTITTTSSWQRLYVTRLIDATATEITVRFYPATDGAGSTLFDGALLQEGQVLSQFALKGGDFSSIGTDLLPAVDNTYDLGSAALRWQDLWLGPASFRITSTTGTAGSGSDYTLGQIAFSGTNLKLATTAVGAGAVGSLQLTTGTNTGIGIDANGNVGIGTTSPGAKLHVVGSSQNTLAVDSPAYPEITLRQNNVSKGRFAIATSAGGYTGGSAAGDIIYYSDGGTHIFTNGSTELARLNGAGNLMVGYTSAPAGTYNLTVAGNVGVGTTNPLFKLDVNGTANIAGALTTTGNITPNADIQYDLGTTALRWKTLHVGPGSVVVHNDATNTLKATLGFTGSVASLLTDASTALWLTTGTNNGIFVGTNGNVGVGTTSPSANLHVIGQCVTAETLLKRKKKRRRDDGTEEEFWEDTSIIDIKPDDEILTLDENTGEFVTAKVKGIMEMGTKDIYKITTKTGKSIRTTGNHPYLTLDKEKINSNKLRAGVFVDDANLYFAAKKAGFRVDLNKLKNIFEETYEIAFTNYYLAVPNQKDKNFERTMNFIRNLPKDVNLKTKPLKYIYDQENQRTITKGDVDLEIALGVINTLKDLDVVIILSGDSDYVELRNQVVSSGKKIIFASYKESLSWEIKLGKHLVLNEMREEIELKEQKTSARGGGLLLSLLYQGQTLMSSPRSWKKVSELNEGEMIAVAGKGNRAVWDRITKIEKLLPEQVFDIEVLGTHNFVGNGIVAHNTYLQGSGTTTGFSLRTADSAGADKFAVLDSGNVGIGTTNPLFKLDVNGTANIAGALTTTGNVTPNADNQYDLGTTALRWKTLHVGPGSLVVHNDATDTLKATLGFTGNRASLLTDAATSLWLATGTNQGMFQDTSGNVGVGTTSPAGRLHVLGQCVAVGTRIRGRRRGQNGEWIEEDIPVEDIEIGDEILTLDEKTGEFIWSKVEETMDKGTQNSFELTTGNGKKIETTAEHPYLIRNLGNIDSNFFHDLTYQTLENLGRKYYEQTLEGKKIKDILFSHEGFEHIVHEQKSKLNILSRILGLPKVLAVLENSQNHQKYDLKEVDDKKHEYWVYEQTIDRVRIQVVVRSIDGGHKHFYSVVWKGFEKSVEGAVSGISHPPRRMGTSQRRVHELIVTFIDEMSRSGVVSLSVLQKFYEMKWTKVRFLTVGQEIATEENEQLRFEKITSIKKMGRKQMFDLQIANTKNFVGNGIVAHNTYLQGSGTGTGFSLRTADSAGADKFAVLDSGNVGIGTTNPLFKLDVNGTANIAGALTTTGNIIPNADDTYDLGSNTFRWQDIYLGPASIHIGTSTSDEYKISYDTTANRLGFNVNGSGNDEIVMDSSGNVGIGTTNPLFKLDVNGTANIAGALTTTGSITPNADIQYDLGTTALRWKTLHVGPGSVVVHNDATNTLKATLGFTGNVASLLADAASALWLTTGTNQGVFVGTNGNVGVGTTSPSANLHVIGQCVTGDTKLRRRKKRSRNQFGTTGGGDGPEPNENAAPQGETLWTPAGGEEFEEVRIDQIQKGDEILTLDESTGEFITAEVRGLKEMGIHQTFILLTNKGKSIRTTANHPYLVRPASTKVQVTGGVLQVDQSPRMEDLTSDTYVALANENVHFIIKISTEYKKQLRKRYQKENRLKFFAADVFAKAVSTLLVETRIEPARLEIDNEYPGYLSRMNQIIKAGSPSLSVTYKSLGHSSLSFAHWAAYRVLKKEYIPTYEALWDENEETKIDRGALKGVGQGVVTLVPLNQIRNTRDLMDKGYQKFSLLSTEEGKWKKVYEIKPGMDVATVDGWEKIIAVKEVAREPVFDIEVEGTHNFVGNGIIAHNTYLQGSGTTTGFSLLTKDSTGANKFAVLDNGNVGIGTTTPGAGLQIVKDVSVAVLGDAIDSTSLTQLRVGGTQGKNISLTYDTTNDYGIIGAVQTAVAWKDLALQPNSSTGIPNVVIKATGNVGIGTVSPASLLSVAGASSIGSTYATFGAPSSGLIVQGNVGIGTSSPLTGANLHVVGQCVSKGTKIRRRRRSRNQFGMTGEGPKPNENAGLQDVVSQTGGWEEVPVEEVQPDDEVLSLNEESGEFEYQRVEKTLDKGVQTTFRLTTDENKEIRTTAEHPYLIRVSKEKETNTNAFLEISFEAIKSLARRYYFDILLKETITSPALGNETVAITRDGWDHLELGTRNEFDVLSRFFALPKVEEVLRGAKNTYPPVFIERNGQKITYWALEAVVDEVLIKVVARSVDGGPKHFFSVVWKGEKEAEKALENKKGTVSRLYPRRQAFAFSAKDIYTTLASELSRETKWIKVRFLKPGQEIAVLGKNGRLEWQKIKSIEKFDREQVYDLQIANTKNFVANGIVAHNTYLRGANTSNLSFALRTADSNLADTFVVSNSGNVGVGTTNPLFKLDVNGTANIAGALTTTGNITPNADIQYDLGTTALRWKTLHVGPGSVVVHNDATNTLKATLGFTGSVASLLTDASTALWLSTGANQGLYLGTNGNVGVGTTSPSANLHVIGQCVTAETVLRRKKKRRKSDGTEEEYWEDVAVVSINEGDEIQTLDENTGELVSSKVVALKKMGIKEITKITTASGRSIRTTANHPYLARVESPKAPRVGIFVDNANLYFAAKSAGWKTDPNRLVRLLKSSLKAVFANYYLAIPDPTDVSFTGTQKFIANLSKEITLKTKPLKYIRGLDGRIQKKGDVDVEIVLDVVRSLPSLDFVIIASGDSDYVELAKFVHEQGKQIAFVGYKHNMAWELRLGQHLFLEKIEKIVRLEANENPDVSAGATLLDQLYQDIASLSNGHWTKVADLKIGQEIAVVGRFGKSVYEKIVKVEHQEAEEVYDIEVEGTHNFVGNGIVAHNTYLQGSGTTTGFSLLTKDSTGADKFVVLDNGNVGIGTTSPTQMLAVGSSSQFNVSSAGAVTAVGVNSGSGLLQGTGGITITGTGNVNATGTSATNIGNSTGALTLSSGGTSAWTNTSGNLTIATATSGTLALDSAGSLTVGGTNATGLTLGRSGVTTTFGSTAWTATPTISGLITATSGLTSNSTVTVNGNFLQTTSVNNGFAGNLGIGTTVPLNRLDVSGSVAIGSLPTTVLPQSNMLYVSGNVGIGTTNPLTYSINATGDINIASAKAYYINGTSVLNGTTLGSGVTGSSLTSVGTIGTGVWQGTSVKTGYGGTGVTSYTAGDLLYYASGTALTNLAIGSTNYVLTSTGTAPSWGLLTGSNITADSLDFTEFRDAMSLDTATSINLNSANFSIAGTGNVGIGTSSPLATSRLTIQGPGTTTNFSLLTQDSGGTHRFAIQDNGNVGIGTTNPLFKLDVNGTANIAGALTTTGSITPNADIQYDLGTTALRWKTLHVGPGSVVVHNDATNTLKATLGFTGSVASLLTDAASALWLTTGANQGIYLGTNGNVGVGTTSPSANLHVIGQCVTGDTLLRRRRRRKGKNGEWIEEWEDARIDEIQAGDEIQTLNEATGKFIPSVVKGLMEMGVKEIYKITTKTGKTIRTTAQHPYLVLEKPKVFAFIDASNIIYGANGWKMDFEKLAHYLTTRYGVIKILYYAGLDSENKKQLRFYEKLQEFGYELRLVPVKKFSDGRKKADVDSRMTFEMMKYANDYDKAVVMSGDGDYYWTLEYLKESKKDIKLISHRESTAQELKRLFGGSFTDISRIRKMVEKVERIKTEQTLLKDLPLGVMPLYYPDLGDLSRAVWTKVSALNEGWLLAVEGNNNRVAFEEIIKIEKLPSEPVYDIEVEGTHNFVGNGIVAHNTYLRGANTSNLSFALRTADSNLTDTFVVSNSGNVGIGTTGPVTALHVAAASTTGVVGTFRNLTAPTTAGQQALLDVGFSDTRRITIGSAADSGVGTAYNGLNYIQSSGKPLTILDDSTTNVMTFNNGNVGIGTTGPGYKLDVTGDVRLTTDLTVGDQLIVSGVGPHAIGGTTNSGVQVYIQGAFPAVAGPQALLVASTLSPTAGTTAYGLDLEPVFVEAASGAHTLITALRIAPSITAGVATADRVSGIDLQTFVAASGTTNAVGLYVAGAPTGATNNYAIYADGTSVLAATTGNVGIGTTGPGTKLEISGAANSIPFQIQTNSQIVSQIVSNNATGDGEFRLYSNTGSGTYGQKILLNTNGSSYLSGGNVGIGTTGPGTKLDVNGSVTLGSKSVANWLLAYGQYYLGSYGATSMAQIGVSAASPTYAVQLGEWNVSDVFVPSVTVKQGGNVGIGTTGPVAKLDTIVASATGSGGADGIRIGDGNGAGTMQLNLGVNTAGSYSWIQSGKASVDAMPLVLNPISGNVGIGTTGPGATLEIAKASAIPSLNLNHTGETSWQSTIGWADDGAVKWNMGSDRSANGGNNWFLDSTDGATYWATKFGATGGLAGNIVLQSPGTGNTGGVGIGYDDPGTAKLAINGNVGIGTTGPQVNLDSVGTIRAISGSEVVPASGAGLEMKFVTGTGGELISYDRTGASWQPIWLRSSQLQFSDSSGEVMRITSGNVGIGTTNPSVGQLQVERATAGQVLYLKSTVASGTNYGLNMDITGAATANYGGYFSVSGATSNYGVYINTPTSGANNWALYSAASAQSYFAGNVGIGTTGPGYTLDIAKAGATAQLYNTTNSGNTDLYLSGMNASANSKYFTMRMTANDATNGAFYLIPNSVTTSAAVLTVQSSGNVGIGTTGPSQKLQVIGQAGFFNGVADRGITINPGLTAGIVDIYSDFLGGTEAKLHLSSYSDRAGANGVTIQNGGNVGIGTTGPGSLLHVDTQSAATGLQNVLRLETEQGTIGDELGILFKIIGNIDAAAIRSRITAAGDKTLSLFTSTSDTTDGSSLTEKVTITHDGNVGIGTTEPESLLHLQKSNSGGLTTLYIDNNAASALNNAASIRFAVDLGASVTNGGAEIKALNVDAGTGYTDLAFTSWGGANTEHMRIKYTGNVGIGTTGPGYQLQVGGNAGTMALGGALGTNSTSRFKFLSSNTVVNWQISHNDSLSSALEFMPSTAAGGTTFTTPTVMMRAGILGVNGGASVGSSYYTTAPPTDGMIIQGNVGIGTTSPGAKLEVEVDNGDNMAGIFLDQDDTGEVALNIDSEATSAHGITLDVGASTGVINLGGYNASDAFAYFKRDVANTGMQAPLMKLVENQASSDETVLYIDNNGTGAGLIVDGGNVGIGTTGPSYKLDVKASGTGAIARFNSDNATGCTIADGGTISCSSDINLKKNVEDLGYGLSSLLSLRPVEFNWKSESDGASKSLGFIAQEVEGIIPKLVTTDADGRKQLNTIGLVPVLAKSIQEQNVSIGQIQTDLNSTKASFNNRLEGLEGRITNQELRIADLEQRTQNTELSQASASAQIASLRSDLQRVATLVEGLTSRETLDAVTFKTPVSLEGNVAIGTALASENTSQTSLAATTDLAITSVSDLNSTDSTRSLLAAQGDSLTGLNQGASAPKTVENFSASNAAGAFGSLPETASVVENFPTLDASVETGDVVTLKDGATVKTLTAGDEKVLGIVTEVIGSNPITQGTGARGLDPINPNVKVILLGKTQVKVTGINGPIKSGDFLRASSTPGFAEKADTAGMILGKALEDYPKKGKGVDQPNKIMAAVNVSWYDPRIDSRPQNTDHSGTTVSGLPSNVLDALTVTGSTSLADLTVAGNVLVSANLNITDVGLGTITGDLEIQKLGRGNVKFFDDKIVFTTDGSITTKGTIIAQEVRSKLVSSKQIKTSELSVGKILVATTSAELVSGGSNPEGDSFNAQPRSEATKEGVTFNGNEASASASQPSSASEASEGETFSAKPEGKVSPSRSDPTIGSGKIEAGQLSVFIQNNQVSSGSKIFVTVTTPTGGRALIVSEKKSDQGFSVEIENASDRDIRFDWWIIN